MPATQTNREVALKSALADDVLLFAGMSGTEELGRLSQFTVRMFSTDKKGAWAEETVTSWAAGGAIAASKYVLNDFDFEKAANSASGALLATANIDAGFDQVAYEMFDYPGNHGTAGAGNALARAHRTPARPVRADRRHHRAAVAAFIQAACSPAARDLPQVCACN